MRSCLLTATCLLLSLPTLAASPEYVVAVSESKGMPFYQLQNR